MIKSPWVWIHEKLTTGVHGVGTDTINEIYDILLKRRWIQIWYANFLKTVTGTGAVNQEGASIKVSTGATNGSTALGYCAVAGGVPRINDEPWWAFEINPRDIADCRFTVAFTWKADPLSESNRIAGIDILDGALRAISGDGTTTSILDLATSLVATRYLIQQRLTASGLETWVDGAAKTTKTTNLPPAAGTIVTWAIRSENMADVDKEIWVYANTVVMK